MPRLGGVRGEGGGKGGVDVMYMTCRKRGIQRLGEEKDLKSIFINIKIFNH